MTDLNILQKLPIADLIYIDNLNICRHDDLNILQKLPIADLIYIDNLNICRRDDSNMVKKKSEVSPKVKYAKYFRRVEETTCGHSLFPCRNYLSLKTITIRKKNMHKITNRTHKNEVISPFFR